MSIRRDPLGRRGDVRAVTCLDRQKGARLERYSSPRRSAGGYVEPRRLVLWLADVDVHAFTGDLAGDTWNVDLNDGLGPLVVQICEHAEDHESNREGTEQYIVPRHHPSCALKRF